MPADESTGPVDAHVRVLRPALDRHDDPFDEVTNDRLAVRGRGPGGPPQRGKIGGQGLDSDPLVGGQLRGALAEAAIAVLLDPSLLSEGFLPTPLQFPRHESVLGVHGMILSRRPLRLVPGPLQPLLPVPGQPLALPLDILAGRQAQLEHRRLQGPEHLPADQVIDDPTGEAGQAGTRLRHWWR